MMKKTNRQNPTFKEAQMEYRKVQAHRVDMFVAAYVAVLLTVVVLTIITHMIWGTMITLTLMFIALIVFASHVLLALVLTTITKAYTKKKKDGAHHE